LKIKSDNKLNIGIVGLGYWGPNWVRNVIIHEKFNLNWVVDLDEKKLKLAEETFNLPQSKVFLNVEDALTSNLPDIVLIATSPSSHLDIAKLITSKKINLIIEKPSGINSEQMLEIIQLEKNNGIKIFVDHTYMFTPAAKFIRETIQSNYLGDLQFVLSSRLNLGLIQRDVDVVRDLAIHDFSLFDYFFEEIPLSIQCLAKTHFPATIDSSASINLNFSKNLLGHINVSWNSPVKVRQMIISGSNKSIIWDDTNQTEKVKIFEASADLNLDDPKRHISYSLGKTEVPKLALEEAIKLELDHIYDCLTNQVKPINGTEHLSRMHKILVASEQSKENQSNLVEIV
jgi:predicted dehydrogenase